MCFVCIMCVLHGKIWHFYYSQVSAVKMEANSEFKKTDKLPKRLLVNRLKVFFPSHILQRLKRKADV
ncbi:hypothetical protein GDO81_015494 [Engystomops pustulosus]|uniref:Uncharacterized protein n=1 Tax=Engystomops pustulosus TaxID=76066 RepID=A0AAV7AP42_ENGPU|nr:hypothetical protein GDO81_015494 [Engystomops pustulosus]KAG8561829.1 hypothetical protein GDO81_015494 [Engystomops pustulosus]